MKETGPQESRFAGRSTPLVRSIGGPAITAVADSDYIALEVPAVAFASGEEAETLHIPLVNDSLPEVRETFYVFLGQRDIETGRLEPIARVRVDVNDDD